MSFLKEQSIYTHASASGHNTKVFIGWTPIFCNAHNIACQSIALVQTTFIVPTE